MEAELDLEYLEKISGGDQEFINDFLATYIEEITDAVSAMKDQAINGDLVKFKGIIHQIKPTLEMVGLTDISKKIAVFELQESSPEAIPGFAESIMPFLENSIREIRKKLDLPG